jgi:ABC-2 type transport system ATP-binding protein
VDEGEIYGFLGLNGAGKTALIRILLGMIKPDKGDVLLFNKQITSRSNQWNDIGYMVETSYSYPDLSVKENLKVYYKLRHVNNSSLIGLT